MIGVEENEKEKGNLLNDCTDVMTFFVKSQTKAILEVGFL